MHDVNGYNTVCLRCESFNSIMREYNIHGNKQAPSRDIANRFAITEHLQFLCHGGRQLMNQGKVVQHQHHGVCKVSASFTIQLWRWAAKASREQAGARLPVWAATKGVEPGQRYSLPRNLETEGMPATMPATTQL